MAKNVEMQVIGTKLVITVDLTQNHGPSSSGRSVIVASTGGTVYLDDEGFPGVGIGLNVFKTKGKEKRRGA